MARELFLTAREFFSTAREFFLTAREKLLARREVLFPTAKPPGTVAAGGEVGEEGVACYGAAEGEVEAKEKAAGDVEGLLREERGG